MRPRRYNYGTFPNINGESRMSKFLASCLAFLKKEKLNVWVVAFGMSLNLLAWVIPFGRLRAPSKDPTGAVHLVSSLISNDANLRYFWHGMMSLTIMTLLLSAYEVWMRVQEGSFE